MDEREQPGLLEGVKNPPAAADTPPAAIPAALPPPKPVPTPAATSAIGSGAPPRRASVVPPSSPVHSQDPLALSGNRGGGSGSRPPLLPSPGGGRGGGRGRGRGKKKGGLLSTVVGGGGGGLSRKAKRRLKYMIAAYLAFLMTILIVVLAVIAVVLQIVLGNPFTSFVAGGICTGDKILSAVGIVHESPYCKAYEALQSALGGVQIQKLESTLGPSLRAQLDCTNVDPAARAAGECIPNLMQTPEDAEANLPIPPRADWLIPIWEKAAAKYHIPWQLLAAVAGARTDFGANDCKPSANDLGSGFYRAPALGGFFKYGVNAGAATTPRIGSNLCTTTSSPFTIFHTVKNGNTNVYDAVDATFTEARMLAAQGANGKLWNNYSGPTTSSPPTGANGATGVSGQPSSVTVQGDSLSVGMQTAFTSDVSPISITSYSAQVGRHTAEGVALLKTQPLSPVVVFALGTNDYQSSAAVYRAQLISALSEIGPSRCLVVPTIYVNKPITALNSVIYSLAQSYGSSRFQVADWSGAVVSQHIQLDSLGIHPADYALRASIVAKAVQACGGVSSAGNVGTSGATGVVGATGDGGSSLYIPSGTPASDGTVFYPPQSVGVGAELGYNSKLDIPRSLVVEAAQYRSNSGQYAPSDVTTGLMPRAVIEQMLSAAWTAFGVTGAENQANVQANLAQIARESGGRPGIIQEAGTVDVNSASFSTLTRGLFQFTPDTFAGWKVDGFNDIFNPLDNILAAVNAQVNSQIGPACEGRVLNGCSGWGPGVGTNPYISGGISTNANVSNTSTGLPAKSKLVNAGVYVCHIPAQTDSTSVAVAYNGSGAASSPCYVSLVYAWYQDILENPSAGGSGDGGSIVQIAQQELAKHVSTGSAEEGIYWYFDPAIGAAVATEQPPVAWCAAFASWVYHIAGVPNFVPSAAVDQLLAWGEAQGTAHAVGSGYIPQPGDLAIYSTSVHVGIVEKVLTNGDVIVIAGNDNNAVSQDPPVNPPDAGEGGINYFVSPGVYPGSAGAGVHTGANGPTGAVGGSGTTGTTGASG